MLLGKFIALLQKMIEKNPKLKHYSLRFREEKGGQEAITHFHIEGRTIILSNVWALDALTPDSPDYKKMKDKIKELGEIEKLED